MAVTDTVGIPGVDFPSDWSKDVGLAENVAAQKLADDVIDLISEQVPMLEPRPAKLFLQRLAEHLSLEGKWVEPERKKPEQLTYKQLGATTLSFGQHAGVELDNVPVYYLDWLCRASEELLQRLKPYLEHEETRKRFGAEG